MRSNLSVYLAEEEIDRRAPVWAAFSELFLDTEITSYMIDAAAASIRGAGYSAHKAKAILENEVAPVFYKNLLSVAGEWAGWTEDSVRDAVLDFLQKNALQRGASTLASKIVKRAYVQHWRDIRSRL